MIQSTQVDETALSSNTAAITFTNTDLRTQGANIFTNWINKDQEEFNIVAGGIYEIDFNCNVTSDTVGMVGLGIYADGVEISEADAVVGVAGEYSNVSMRKFIRVSGRGSITITINSVPSITYEDVTTETEIPVIKNANIIIKRY